MDVKRTNLLVISNFHPYNTYSNFSDTETYLLDSHELRFLIKKTVE